MARRAGTDVYRVSIRGAGRVAADLERVARAIQDDVVAEVRQFGRESVLAFRAAAPKDTEDLAEAVDAILYFRAIRPRASIRVAPLRGHQGDDRDDFDYLRVSRFGHMKRTISPVTARALRVHYAGHRNPEVYEYRMSVKGSRPATDWVATGAAAVERLADGAERRLGRRVERSIRR